jgi:hypothetical protein
MALQRLISLAALGRLDENTHEKTVFRRRHVNNLNVIECHVPPPPRLIERRRRLGMACP